MDQTATEVEDKDQTGTEAEDKDLVVMTVEKNGLW